MLGLSPYCYSFQWRLFVVANCRRPKAVCKHLWMQPLRTAKRAGMSDTAYALWEQAGRPDDGKREFWNQAETDLAAAQAELKENANNLPESPHER